MGRPKVTSNKAKPRWLGYALLLALALLALWQQRSGYTNPSPAGTANLRVYFMPEDEDKALSALNDSLGGARRTLDLALLELNDTRLGSLLVSVAARGVRVRIFSEREHRTETLQTLLAARQGQQRGRPRVSGAEARAAASPSGAHCERIAKINVCYDDRPGLMHDKFAVVDDSAAWSGSTNWSYNGLHKNDNDLLLLSGQPAAKVYHDAFTALWERKGSSPSPKTLDLGGGKAEVYFAPSFGRQAEARIVKELQGAQKEILMAAFVLTNPRIISALNAAARRGVMVRVLLERRNLPDSREEDLDEKVQTRLDANPYTMHLKTIVIDDRSVITGSFNFTRSAVSRNDENLLVLTYPKLARRYKEKVWELWQAASRR